MNVSEERERHALVRSGIMARFAYVMSHGHPKTTPASRAARLLHRANRAVVRAIDLVSRTRDLRGTR